MGTKKRTYTAEEFLHRPRIAYAIQQNDLSIINVNGKIIDVSKNEKTQEITIEWEEL